MNMQSRRCVCLFPHIVFPGECIKCELTHLHAERIRIQATQIPFRHFSAGKISWQQHERLTQEIEDIVWRTFNSLRDSVLGERSVLGYFQETIYEEVEQLLLEEHDIVLDEQDERLFRVIDLADLLPQFTRK